MKVIIRSPKSEDYDRFSNIMDQVQQLHVEWRPDVYKPASPLITREAFEEILKDNGIEVTVRREMGTDINAACGQLRRSYLEENK